MVNATMKKLGEERSIIREIFEYGNCRAAEIGRENIFDFSLGNPNVPAPECVQKEIKRLVEEVPPEKLHGYTSAQGDKSVREKIANYIQNNFGASSDPNLIYMTCGASASLAITLKALNEDCDEFIVVAPYFPEYRVFTERAGGKVVEVKTDENFHLDVNKIESAITKKTKGIIINSPNNPSGAIYTEEEIKALARVLEKKQQEFNSSIILICDEPYRELTYEQKVAYIPLIYANTVVCYSFSKSLSLAGERLGYIFVSPKCKNAQDIFSAVCGAGRSLGYVCAPSLFQHVCANNLGRSSDVEEYKKNRDILYRTLSEYGFTCSKPDGAFYLFVKSPEPDAMAFSQRAKKYEILIVPSDSFGVEGYVRISYCVARDTIERSLPAFRLLAKEYGLLK